jgi:hypothetical protein
MLTLFVTDPMTIRLLDLEVDLSKLGYGTLASAAWLACCVAASALEIASWAWPII